jgi:L,D-transpeptidase YcbB
MDTHKRIFLYFLVLFIVWGCGNDKKEPRNSSSTTTLNETEELDINDVLNFVGNHHGKFSDSSQLVYPALLKAFYASKDGNTVWSKKSGFTALADTLQQFIEQSMQYGLFPEDYHYSLLKQLRSKFKDSGSVNKTTILSQSDLLYSDAFIRIAEHLKKGRLAKDSLTLTADTALQENYFVGVLKNALSNKNITGTLQTLEPTHKDYSALRNALPEFVRNMDLKHYTYIVYPNKDSAQYVKAITQRLYEAGFIENLPNKPDSSFLATAIIKYQKSKGLKVTGKPNAELVKNMNTSAWYQFKRIAATLDRFKTLPATLPETYVWVNLPSYKLKVVHHDTTVMTSKVIIGKTTNKTPELNSLISNIVLYPTWSVPYSIAIKEMLPIAKRNPGYFAKRGFKVFNNRGKLIDPYSVNWSKYSKNVPFSFRQNEGGGNALGVIKFNFENPYAVYLHDTNQRSLFERDFRALSHGCVRVHLWDSMARYLIKQSRAYFPNYETSKRDSITANNDTITLTNAVLKDNSYIIADSLHRYMAKKKNMALIMTDKVALYIRYYGCEAKDGKIVFFDDVYGEDKVTIDQYFSKK